MKLPDVGRPFLPSYRPPLQPQSHLDGDGLGRLATGRSGGVVWVDSLQSLLQGVRQRDVRGIYHWSTAGGDRSLKYAIERCLIALDLNKGRAGLRLHAGLLTLLRPYYASASDECGMVLFESCRDLSVDRFQEFTRQGTAIRQVPVPNTPIRALWDRSMARLSQRPLMLKGYLPLDPNLIPLVLPSGRRASQCYLRGGLQRRLLALRGGPESILGDWEYWCLATPGADDAALRAGQYPAKVAHLVGDRINPCPLMTWMRFHPRDQLSYNLCLDIDPESARAFSVRFVALTLKDYLVMDPRMDYWLHAAIRYQPSSPLADEQIDAPQPTPRHPPRGSSE